MGEGGGALGEGGGGLGEGGGGGGEGEGGGGPAARGRLWNFFLSFLVLTPCLFFLQRLQLLPNSKRATAMEHLPPTNHACSRGGPSVPLCGAPLEHTDQFPRKMIRRWSLGNTRSDLRLRHSSRTSRPGRGRNVWQTTHCLGVWSPCCGRGRRSLALHHLRGAAKERSAF